MDIESFEFPFKHEPFNEVRAIQFEEDTDRYLDEFLESLRD